MAEVAADDIWARDTGPITVIVDGQRRFLDFRFDGWGGKFSARADDALCAQLHAGGWLGADPLDRLDIVLEGGSVESNGAGTVLTTTRCLLAGKRNADLDQATLEDRLRDTLGAHTVHWLAHGDLLGDDLSLIHI